MVSSTFVPDSSWVLQSPISSSPAFVRPSMIPVLTLDLPFTSFDASFPWRSFPMQRISFASCSCGSATASPVRSSYSSPSSSRAGAPTARLSSAASSRGSSAAISANPSRAPASASLMASTTTPSSAPARPASSRCRKLTGAATSRRSASRRSRVRRARCSPRPCTERRFPLRPSSRPPFLSTTFPPLWRTAASPSGAGAPSCPCASRS
mmetsp:Transcript_36465/g.91764  ORF Transcript_36465/g.91764 Transcript_36465/m.91764 type:complete len:209 (-) Transcript_36465:279-905(-)